MHAFGRRHSHLLVQPGILHTRIDGPRRAMMQHHHIAGPFRIRAQPRRKGVGFALFDRQPRLMEMDVHGIGPGFRDLQAATLRAPMLHGAVERPRRLRLRAHEERPGIIRRAPLAVPIAAAQAVFRGARAVFAFIEPHIVNPHVPRRISEAQVHSAVARVIFRRRERHMVFAPVGAQPRDGRTRALVPPVKHHRGPRRAVDKQRR